MMTSQYNHRRMNKTEKLSDDSLVNITILDGSAVTLRKEDYKNADCIFICFDVTSDQSFVNAKNKWSQKIKQYGIQNDDVIVFLLGCKNDSPSQWNRAEAEATQRVLHIGNVQLCSARTGDQVNGTFKTAAELVYQQKLEHKSSLKSNCMKNGYDISADIEQKDEQIQRLQQTKDVIQTKYESSKRQIGQHKRQIERMRNEKRDMDQKAKEYAQQNESSKRQIGDCKRQIERMRNEKRDMDQKAKEYAQQNESSKRQIGDCKRQFERMRNEKRDMDQKAKEYAQNLVQYKTNIEQKDEQFQRLQQTKDVIQTKYEAMCKQNELSKRQIGQQIERMRNEKRD
eukprot:477015_1